MKDTMTAWIEEWQKHRMRDEQWECPLALNTTNVQRKKEIFSEINKRQKMM